MADWKAPHLDVDEDVPLDEALDEDLGELSIKSWGESTPEERARYLAILDRQGHAHDSEGNVLG